MPRAKLSVTLPADVWARRVTESFDETTLEVVSALTDGDTGTALLEVTSPELRPVVEEIGADDAVTDLELLRVVDDHAMVQVETDRPLLLQTLEASQIPFDTPLHVEDGDATLTVTTTRDRLADLGDHLDTFGMSFEVLYIHESADPAELLTVPQRELLTAAIEAGYYETPRECSLTELARQEGIAKSSASERLHRAESRVVRDWAADAFLTEEGPDGLH
jgi:predicted DNA binding protein